MSTFFCSVALILFLLFVMPLWLWLHYSTKRQSLSRQEIERLHLLVEESQRLGQRILALEAILESENRHWRDQP